MQVSALSAQMRLGLELVVWCRDATSVPYGHLLIELSPRTDDRLRCCVNTQTLVKFPHPDRLKQSKFLDGDHTKTLNSPCDPIIFPQMQKLFHSVLPKNVYQVPLRMNGKSSQRKPVKHKKTAYDKIWKRNLIVLSRRNHLESLGTWDVLASEKVLQLMKVINPPICLDMEQFVLVPASVLNSKSLRYPANTKEELPRLLTDQNYTYQIDSPKKEINKKLFALADSLVDKILSWPRIKLSNSQTLLLDGVETRVLL